MTPFKIFFVGIMTFVHMANGTKHVIVPNASGGGRVVGTRHVESHTAYVGFKMSDYIRSDGWDAPITFNAPVEVKAIEVATNVQYGMYALDGYTISVSHAPQAFTPDPSHCRYIPHLTLECPSFGELHDSIGPSMDKNRVAADMVIDSGDLYAKATNFGAIFSRLELNTPQNETEIKITATSFGRSIVRNVYLKAGATIWFGNEWSGKFTGWKPKGHHHFLLNYLLADGTPPDCTCKPKVIRAQCPNEPVPPAETPAGPETCDEEAHNTTKKKSPSKAYSISCSNSNYP